MKYRIKHGNIAGILYVTMSGSDGKEYAYAFINNTQTELAGGFWPLFDDLPLAVRAAINKQFGQVFSLPVEQRGAWVKAQVPFEVEAEAPNGS